MSCVCVRKAPLNLQKEGKRVLVEKTESHIIILFFLGLFLLFLFLLLSRSSSSCSSSSSPAHSRSYSTSGRHAGQLHPPGGQDLVHGLALELGNHHAHLVSLALHANRVEDLLHVIGSHIISGNGREESSGHVTHI